MLDINGKVEIIFNIFKIQIAALATCLACLDVYADQIEFCSSYAKNSVVSHINNVKSNCGLTGELWSPGLKAHQQWCLNGNHHIAKQHLSRRQSSLDNCGRAMQRSIEWDDIDFNTQNQLFGELILAVASDDVESLKIFEAQGVDLNFEWHLVDGGLLFWAISNQASQVSHYLIKEKSANPNLTSNGGPNPLVKLLNHAPHVNYRLLDYLLRAGARPNHGGEEYSDDSFPLTTAAKNNDLESVRILLKYKADPNLYESTPPIMMGIYNNNSRMVDLLLKHGAIVNRGLKGATCQLIQKTGGSGKILPLDAAIDVKNSRILNALAQQGAKTSKHCSLASN